MNQENVFAIDSLKSPMCLGIGLVSIDVIETGGESFAVAGGSCGNVMAILAWFGWDAAPASRIGCDWGGEYVKQDLGSCGVKTDLLIEEDRIRTPIILQRFVEDRNGRRTHRFSMVCPECGGWLPRYRPLTLRQAEDIVGVKQVPRALYFDRVSPGALRVARWARESGALIVFEPSSIGDERQFQNAVDLCHVLKYSYERLGHVMDLGGVTSPSIVVETRGAEGLRFRWRSRWTELAAFGVSNFRDAAGSGDWCSAGLIHMLGEKGGAMFKSLAKGRIVRALQFGQALAAVNCCYEGARGAMLALSREGMNRALAGVSELESGIISMVEDTIEYSRLPPKKLCATCESSEGIVKSVWNKKGNMKG